MIKTVLVPATGTDVDAAAFAAHLDVLHVRIDAAEAAGTLVTDVGGAMVSATLIDRLEEECAPGEHRRQRSRKHGVDVPSAHIFRVRICIAQCNDIPTLICVNMRSAAPTYTKAVTCDSRRNKG
jgi:hypothetical protein